MLVETAGIGQSDSEIIGPRRPLALRDDARLRRADPAREDRHAGPRRSRGAEQERPARGAGRAARRAQAVAPEPRRPGSGRRRAAGVPDHRARLERSRDRRALRGAAREARRGARARGAPGGRRGAAPRARAGSARALPRRDRRDAAPLAQRDGAAGRARERRLGPGARARPHGRGAAGARSRRRGARARPRGARSRPARRARGVARPRGPLPRRGAGVRGARPAAARRELPRVARRERDPEGGAAPRRRLGRARALPAPREPAGPLPVRRGGVPVQARRRGSDAHVRRRGRPRAHQPALPPADGRPEGRAALDGLRQRDPLRPRSRRAPRRLRQGRHLGGLGLHGGRRQEALLGLRPRRARDLRLDDHQRPGADDPGLLPERRHRPGRRARAPRERGARRRARPLRRRRRAAALRGGAAARPLGPRARAARHPRRPRDRRRALRADPRRRPRPGARHGAGGHPEGGPGPEHLHLLDGVRAEADGRRAGVVRRQRGAELLLGLDLGLPHGRGRGEPDQPARLHPRQRLHVLRVLSLARHGGGRLRAELLVLLQQRSGSRVRRDRPRGAADLGDRDARALRRRRAQPEAEVPRADLGPLAPRARDVLQRHPHHAPGAARAPGQLQQPAHQRLRRGGHHADAGVGAAGAGDPAHHPARARHHPEREPAPGLAPDRGAHRSGGGGGAPRVRADLRARRRARRDGDALPARAHPGGEPALRVPQALGRAADHRRQHVPLGRARAGAAADAV